jgi:hypothetical protein
MDQELAHFRVLENALADCEHLMLHFRGPVCDLSVTAVTGRLRDLLAGQGVPLPQAVRASSQTQTSRPSASRPSNCSTRMARTSHSATPKDKRWTCPRRSPWPQAQT